MPGEEALVGQAEKPSAAEPRPPADRLADAQTCEGGIWDHPALTGLLDDSSHLCVHSRGKSNWQLYLYLYN